MLSCLPAPAFAVSLSIQYSDRQRRGLREMSAGLVCCDQMAKRVGATHRQAFPANTPDRHSKLGSLLQPPSRQSPETAKPKAGGGSVLLRSAPHKSDLVPV